MLAFFSISAGLWENFRQLWLQEQGFSATEISFIISLGAILSIGGIILAGHFLKMSQLKTMVASALSIKLVNFFILLGLSQQVSHPLIIISIVVDILTSCLIITSAYPLITIVMKSSQAYSRRKLVEYLFRDVGIMIGGLIFGRSLFGILIDYNLCIMVSALFLVLSLFVLSRVRLTSTQLSPAPHKSVVRLVVHDRIQILYMVYAFLTPAAFMTALGLKMLMLTGYLNLSISAATGFVLFAGLAADILGVLALRYFTPKNDYLSLTLKFGTRLLAYIIAILANNPFIFLLAIIWAIMVSTIFEDVCDGYYINAIDNNYQLRYGTLRYVVAYFGEAVGMLFCGVIFGFGPAAMLGLASGLTVIQLLVAYSLIYLRHRQRCSSRPLRDAQYNERTITHDSD